MDGMSAEFPSNKQQHGRRIEVFEPAGPGYLRTRPLGPLLGATLTT